MEKKYRIATLGCRTNQYESEAYRSQMEKLGFREAKEGESADLCIVNTCTVTESADSHSRNEIRGLIRKNQGAKIVVTGCMVESRPKLLEEIPEITHIIPNQEKETLIERLFPDEENLPEFSIQQFEAHTRAFVKVQDGCNSFCTYCVIPYVRGRSRSRPVADVLREIEALVVSGYKEVVITGINVGDYDQGTLADLVREVDKLEGLERIRISSIDPDEVDDNLLDAVIQGKKTCHSMHLVLQSGSNVILKRMNRKYTRQMFLHSVQRLKEASPDFTFTTDVIVGFPGETETDFQETLDVMREVGFAKVHMFPYSPRPRTRAALYPNQVAKEVIAERKSRVLRLAEECSFKLRDRFLGRKMRVLTESLDKEREIIGHTENFLEVRLPKGSLVSNQIVEATLVANTPQGLTGRVDACV